MYTDVSFVVITQPYVCGVRWNI